MKLVTIKFSIFLSLLLSILNNQYSFSAAAAQPHPAASTATAVPVATTFEIPEEVILYFTDRLHSINITTITNFQVNTLKLLNNKNYTEFENLLKYFIDPSTNALSDKFKNNILGYVDFHKFPEIYINVLVITMKYSLNPQADIEQLQNREQDIIKRYQRIQRPGSSQPNRAIVESSKKLDSLKQVAEYLKYTKRHQFLIATINEFLKIRELAKISMDYLEDFMTFSQWEECNKEKEKKKQAAT